MRPDLALEVVGHSDTRDIDVPGIAEDDLGAARAQAVRDRLIQRGIAPSRIDVATRARNAAGDGLAARAKSPRDADAPQIGITILGTSPAEVAH
jgi:outer membrane protein OmpA-like peptidoglycan-associated protein